MPMRMFIISLDLGGGFKDVLFSPRMFGEMIQFDGWICFKWVGEKPPTSDFLEMYLFLTHDSVSVCLLVSTYFSFKQKLTTTVL